MEDISHIILPGISYFIFLGATARLTTAEPPKPSLSLPLCARPGWIEARGSTQATEQDGSLGVLLRTRRRPAGPYIGADGATGIGSCRRRHPRGAGTRGRKFGGSAEWDNHKRWQRDDEILGQSPVCIARPNGRRRPACLFVSCALRRGVKVEHARWIAAGRCEPSEPIQCRASVT